MTWRLLGIAAVAGTLGAYRATDVEAVMSAAGAMVLWGYWAISATNVTKSVGQCCVYHYDYAAFGWIGIAGAFVALVAVVDMTLGMLDRDGIGDRLSGIMRGRRY